MGFDWLSLVGPVLKVGAKYKETDLLTRSDYSELIVLEVVVWLPKLVAAEVMSQSSTVTYGLAIFCLSENRRGDKNHSLWKLQSKIVGTDLADSSSIKGQSSQA